MSLENYNISFIFSEQELIIFKSIIYNNDFYIKYTYELNITFYTLIIQCKKIIHINLDIRI